MEWKSEVTIEKENGFILRYGNREKEMADEDLIIAELMEQGVTDDEELLKRVSELTESGDILAGFRLAQFVEDYGEFLKEGKKSNVFEF